MEMVGFVLLVIGITISLAARRIVMAKTVLDEKDRKEMELLASGAIIAVRVSGVIVALVGIMFLAL